MTKMILYSLDISPPVRVVKAVADLLGLELETRNVDLFQGEHLKESFVKLNPEHTVPTLDDNGFVIWDSHAICAYLVDKYAKNDKLYPKDLQLRAKCNQRLFFDASNLYQRFRDCVLPIYFKGCTEASQDNIDSAHGVLDILEAFLASDSFLVGNNLTIADISVFVTVRSLKMFMQIKDDRHPKISAWFNRVDQLIPIDKKIGEHYQQTINSFVEKNKQKQ